MIIMSVLSLVLGFALLLGGANLLVFGATSFAKKLGLSPLFIGLSVVALGTSLPELMVNIHASFKGHADVAIGNILGSNIANVLLVLGISSLIKPLLIKREVVFHELLLFVLATILFLGCIYIYPFLFGSPVGLYAGGGILLLLFLGLFLRLTMSSSAYPKEVYREDTHQDSFFKPFLQVAIGSLCLAYGGSTVVESATSIAVHAGMSDSVIGLTILALGTSLPELATSVVAAYKNNVSLALGNVVGSNVINLTLVLGISSFITDLRFSQQLLQDLFVVILVSVLLFLCMFVGKRYELKRWQGGVFVALYVIYIGTLFFRIS